MPNNDGVKDVETTGQDLAAALAKTMKALVALLAALERRIGQVEAWAGDHDIEHNRPMDDADDD